MDEHNKQRHDRHLRLAAGIAANPDHLAQKFTEARILLTGKRERLLTPAGRLMFKTATNLIVRFCPQIDFSLPSDCRDLEVEAMALASSIDGSAESEYRSVEHPQSGDYKAVLSIGRLDFQGPITIIDAQGWLSALGNASSLPLIREGQSDNPFGPLMAAALGTAEVFKQLLEPLKPDKASYFGDVTFSTFDYSVSVPDTGPALPERITIPRSLLAGVGAVGNAFMLALRSVPNLDGVLFAVDQEKVDDPSNLNRYVLAIEHDADPLIQTPKPALAVRASQNTRLEVTPFHEPLESFLSRIYKKEVARPAVVLSAVDNNDARALLQKLWPDLLIEGATDNTLSQVSRHEFAEGLGCLLCIHDFNQVDPAFSYEAHMAKTSGLPESLIKASQADPSLLLREEHLKDLKEDQQKFFSERTGKPICSVLGELERFSANPAATPVRPTVSFVSMISGLLMAAELVKYASGMKSALETFAQLDSMFPLHNLFLQGVDKLPSCYCVQRKTEIRLYRSAFEA